jgi:DNA-binding transcriptional regulator GbsR (MarR family)
VTVAVLKPRERLVYFRITEDEFHQFAGVCEQEGARSISDLARSAVQRLIAESNREREGQDLAPKMQSLEKLIAEVTAQLQMLCALRAQTVIGEHGVINQGADGYSSEAKSADYNGHKEEQLNGNPS